MTDRKKVIKGLEICIDREPGKYTCYECPYEVNGNDCEISLTKDALALLKEQEPETGCWVHGHCSCCGEDLGSKLDTWTNIQQFLFCPKCGAKMLEDE